MDKKSFEYGGYHFYPLRTFEDKDGDFMERACKLRDDRELGMTSTDEPWRKYAYDYEAFYKAAGGKKYDIFLCEENRRQYVPCVMACRNLLMPRSRVKITGQSAESMMARVLRKTHGMG